ncbi:MAG: ABC transporter substrate-binding protein, partial [Clostridia bacterium]|nr:ABC transporter substrate-binding protein [Clostridia bacterium]
VSWGFDSDRLETAVVTTSFIKKSDREALKALWDTAVKNGTKYDAKAFLKEKEYTLTREYNTTFNSIPQTLDIQGTSRQADTEFIVQGLDTLLKYDETNKLQPAIASSYDVSEDGKTYTFHLRDDAKWYQADKTEYAAVKADDFVAGFQHMLDAKSGLAELLQGIVKGVSEYLAGSGTFEDVGVEAPDDRTFVVKLEKEVPYFDTMITYNIFTPLNRQFFITKGGAFGLTQFKTAKEKDTYKYGKAGVIDSILYNGAFICTEMTDQKKITYVQNPGYYDKDKMNVDKLTYIYNDGSDPQTYYADVKSGKYAGISLSSQTLPLAQEDGNFEKYAYVTSTGATTYFSGNNLHRVAYDCEAYPKKGTESTKSEAAKTLTQRAMYSKNFRKALNYSFNKHAYQAASKGEELANASIRNMYTQPDFLRFSKDVTVDGHKFEKGSTYGEAVQYYFDQLNNDGIQLADGVDGWYKPDLAKKYMQMAVKDLGGQSVVNKKNPIEIDIVNYSASTVMVNQAEIYKKYVEEATGGLVKVNVRASADIYAYYYSGYYAETGAEANYDVFFGSGWGPDYGDPITYLNTFLPDGDGYMTKVCGLY